MKRYICLIGIILISSYLYGCKGEFFGPGMADYNYGLSGRYHLYKGGTAAIWSSNQVGRTKVIGVDVTGIAWNQDYILVRQQVEKSKNYWIIDVRTSMIYGPMDEKDFEIQREDLKISTDLKLEYPVKYKNLEKADKKQ